MYKGKRYNFLVVCLLLVISIVVGFSAGMSKSNSTNTDASWEEEIPDNLLPEEGEIDENTNISGAPGADASAFERLTYAINMIDKGAGYTSYLSQSLDASGNKQFMVFKRYRGGNLDLTEEWYKFQAVVAFLQSFGKHEFGSYYSDGTNVKFKLIEDSRNFNFDQKTYDYKASHKLEQYSVDHYENVLLKTKLNAFYTTINESTCSVEKYDKKSDPDNYIIKVNVNPQKLDQRYLSNFTSTGASNINIKTETITFKINKKTGYMASYEKYEVFTASQVGITLEFVANLKETYLTMNRSAESTIRNIVSQSFSA